MSSFTLRMHQNIPAKVSPQTPLKKLAALTDPQLAFKTASTKEGAGRRVGMGKNRGIRKGRKRGRGKGRR